ncbi:MAG: porin [Thiotrichales bacterium]|nr:porin [Thiotrichales bacterium]
MKKNIIALAIATAVAAPAAFADAPTVYGQLNLNINAEDRTGDKGLTVDSVASRLGIKGSEDLGDGLKAIYMIEFGLDGVADGANSSQALSNRNQYLGLAGSFGTVLLGRHDTPTKMIQPDDLFNDGAADVNQMTGGVLNGEVRASDVAAYVSPEFSGFKVIAAAVMDEGTASTMSGEQVGDWVNVALTYGSTKKGLYAAAAWQDLGDNAADLDATIVRVSAQYKTGALVASVMHQDVSGDVATGSFTHLQAGYKMGKFMPKIKIALTDNDATDTETAYAVGLNYSLGKKTTGYVYATEKEDIGGINGAYVGLLHKF